MSKQYHNSVQANKEGPPILFQKSSVKIMGTLSDKTRTLGYSTNSTVGWPCKCLFPDAPICKLITILTKCTDIFILHHEIVTHSFLSNKIHPFILSSQLKRACRPKIGAHARKQIYLVWFSNLARYVHAKLVNLVCQFGNYSRNKCATYRRTY